MQDKIKTDFGISIKDDCLNVIKKMPSNYVDMVVTDPPYGINYQSNGRKNKRICIVWLSRCRYAVFILKQNE